MDMNTTSPTSPRTATARENVKGLATWMLLIDGILLVILGALVILGVKEPNVETNIVRIFGGVLCAAGVLLGFRLWKMTQDRELNPMIWLMSIVPVVLGVILIVWPIQARESLLTILALALIIRGVIESSVALARRTRPGWPFLLSHGIAAIATGVLFWLIPQLAVVLLILFMGIDLIMQGAHNVSMARQLKQQVKHVP
ncbi:MAG: hypothetical protein CMJ39_07050 [Phycisphaerae bacterium]|nr:hypothetical protein [Phycisphaerae bacterium]|tara:strand:+ start:1864 stop:2460 length:597 start_codon:yes stop_codon:yes gene_type:complete